MLREPRGRDLQALTQVSVWKSHATVKDQLLGIGKHTDKLAGHEAPQRPSKDRDLFLGDVQRFYQRTEIIDERVDTRNGTHSRRSMWHAVASVLYKDDGLEAHVSQEGKEVESHWDGNDGLSGHTVRESKIITRQFAITMKT
jgi:hypothetical protein